MTHTGKADVVLVVVVMFGNGYKKRQAEETYRFLFKNMLLSGVFTSTS